MAFPFVLFSRFKYIVLAMLLGMHASIAVLMGLPFFSAAMIIADAVFLPDRFYRFIAQAWRQSPTADWYVRRRSRIRWLNVPSQTPRSPKPTADIPATQHDDDSATANV